MIEVVILDAGPLGMVTNPRRSPLNMSCARWLQSLFATGNGDVILAAQAVTLSTPSFVIATTNVGHLRRFAPAELWTDLQPG
ncbi:hypothetical protein GC175_16915 [bacterium]|nr:hypothetical protein [bacterium]